MKDRLFIALFFLLCLVPVAGMLVLEPTQPAANETLASPPVLTDGEEKFNPAVLTEVSDYLDQHFALRQELVTANHALHTALFGTSPEEDVILGKDGWLFYGETLEDYEGIGGMTDRELWSAAHTLALIQEYCESRGVTFLFTVAPNKNSLYGEYMPDRYPQREEARNIAGLAPRMEAEGIHYADLFSLLSGEETVLYRRLDSHWTQQGAGLAGDKLLEILGKETTPFYGGQVQTVSEEIGDLYEILYPTGKTLDQEQVYTRPFTFTYTAPIRSVEDNFIRTEQTGQTGSLLMFRDSFGNALHRFLAEGYGACTFCRLTPYNLGLIDAEGADTVVIELVERNLDWLITRPAVFPAPVRQLTGTPQVDPALEAAITAEPAEDLPGYTKLTGALTGAQIEETSPIYLRLGGTIYEATPTGEATFTAYVPETTAPPTVLLARGGQLWESTPNS